MQKLYTDCLANENIEKAIKKILSNSGAKTPGVDGISKTSKISKEKIIKAVQSRKINIPKGNG